MKKFILPLLCLTLLAVSCTKEKSIDSGDPSSPTNGGGGGGNNPGTSGGSFEVKLNGQLINFTVESATLIRSTSTSEKRLDINGTSKDGKKKLILTFHEMSADGNGIPVKTYSIKMFNDDDPNTPEDESDDSMDGFITYGTSLGSNSWMYEIYSQNGIFTVTSCDANAKKVSGTFKVTLVNLNDPSNKEEFTEGKFNNVAYMVLN